MQVTGTHWGWLIQRSKFIHLFFCSNLENKTQWQLPGSPWHTLSPIERATCSQFRFPRGKNPSALPGRCPLGSPRLGPQGWGCAAGGRGDGPQPLLSSRQACLGAAVLCFRTRTPQPSPGSGERMGRVRGWAGGVGWAGGIIPIAEARWQGSGTGNLGESQAKIRVPTGR